MIKRGVSADGQSARREGEEEDERGKHDIDDWPSHDVQ
jgi:hypothetical protein